jgi:cytoskeleton protein RodZ
MKPSTYNRSSENMSAVISEQNVSNITELLTPGPGERLRAARLASGFDLAKIASELHLTSAVVASLEADDYAEIGARVFVRGYLRNYARIVGMPVESILRQFDERWPDEGAHRAVVRQSPRLPADGGPGRGLAGAVTWLLLIGSVVLFLMWWRGYLGDAAPQYADAQVGGEAALAPTAAGSDALGLAPEVPFADASADGTLALPLPPVDPAEVLPSSEPASDRVDYLAPAEPASAPAEVAAPAPATARNAVSLETLPPMGQAVAAPPAASRVAAESAASPADGGAPVIEGGRQIVMSFNAPSWVDVRDSERKFKLFGEMPKGTRRVLGGEPPYKLVIGNAQAVSITVNGQPFDITRYAKGNVARFTLDP